MRKDSYYQNRYIAETSDLLGKVFSEVKATEGTLTFKCDEGIFTFYHENECCETVEIESIVGDMSDLIGEPLLLAEEVTSHENPADAKPETIKYQDQDTSFTWTFYKFATRNGYVDVRWYGDSTGYYSESVDLKFEPFVKATGDSK